MAVLPSSVTQESICNMALAHLKITRQIGNLTTDNSAEAVACRTFYNIVKQQMLEDFKYPFATTQAALALVEESPFPINANGDSEWAYAYEYPADALTFYRIVGNYRNESRLDRIPFRIFNNPDDDSKLILTDMDQAVGEWTTYVVTEDMYSPTYVLAMSFMLASLIAPMVTGGDPFKLGDRAEKKYQEYTVKARSNSLNEEQPEVEVDSEFVLARGFRNLPNSSGGFNG